MRKIKKRKTRSDKGKARWRPRHLRTVEQHRLEQEQKEAAETWAEKHAAAQKRTAKEERLRAIVREAAESGLIAAIESTHNFWQISEGFKKYIERQVQTESAAMVAAMHSVLAEELAKFMPQKARKRGRPRLQ